MEGLLLTGSTPSSYFTHMFVYVCLPLFAELSPHVISLGKYSYDVCMYACMFSFFSVFLYVYILSVGTCFTELSPHVPSLGKYPSDGRAGHCSTLYSTQKKSFPKHLLHNKFIANFLHWMMKSSNFYKDNYCFAKESCNLNTYFLYKLIIHNVH